MFKFIYSRIVLSTVLIPLIFAAKFATDVDPPAVLTPTNDMLFSKKDPTKPDLDFIKNHFAREGRLTEEQALYIINKGTECLKKEPNMLEIEAPITGIVLINILIYIILNLRFHSLW